MILEPGWSCSWAAVGEVRILNVDLSTITTEADSVLLVQEIEPWLVHLEFQSSYDRTLPQRLQRDNTLVNYRHQLPVQSIARRSVSDADGPAMTGLLQQRLPDGLIYHEFRYNVVRTWERPAAEILAGGLATLPLAPLARLNENELPAVIQAMQQRLDREATTSQAGMFWTATYVLMGLKYPDELIDRLLEGVQNMKESVTYQKILRDGPRRESRWDATRGCARRESRWDATRDAREGIAVGRDEGCAEEARRILRQLGIRRFEMPAPHIEAALDAIADLERLEQLAVRVFEAKTWDELLAQP